MIDVINFMLKNSITPIDLKIKEDNENYNHEYIEGITKDDFSKIHSAYWKHYHKNKNKLV
jgi:hypothetical protein